MNLYKIIPFIIVSLSIPLTVAYSLGSDTTFNLMPVPEKIIKMDGRFRLDTTFTICIKGYPAAAYTEPQPGH